MREFNISNSMDHEKNNSGKVPSNNGDFSYPEYENTLPEEVTLTDEEIERLTAELEITNTHATLNRSRKENLNVLNSILSEYLDAYMLVGYTAENDEVIAHKIMTSRDSRAITSLINDIKIGGMPHQDMDDDFDDFEDDD